MTTVDTYANDLPTPHQTWAVKAGLWTATTGLVLIATLAFLSDGAAEQHPSETAASVETPAPILPAAQPDIRLNAAGEIASAEISVQLTLALREMRAGL